MKNFEPHYVYCDCCGTGFSVSLVGPLCPICDIPFHSVQGVMREAAVDDSGTATVTLPPKTAPSGDSS